MIGAQGGMRELERQVLLQVMDRKWREHLYEMDYLKEGIGLRAMAQRDPLIEYQREGFDMFAAMLEGIKEETVGHLFNVRVQAAAPPAAPEPEADGEAASPVERTSPTRAVAPAASSGGPGCPGDPGGRADHPGPRAVRQQCTRPARGARERRDGGHERAAHGAGWWTAEGVRAAVQRAGRRRGHQPQPVRQGGGRGRCRRRAGAEPAVPVRFGPQVQALPRDADGRASLIATGQRSRSVTHRHRRGSSGSAAGTRSKRAASARARDPRR